MLKRRKASSQSVRRPFDWERAGNSQGVVIVRVRPFVGLLISEVSLGDEPVSVGAGGPDVVAGERGSSLKVAVLRERTRKSQDL